MKIAKLVVMLAMLVGVLLVNRSVLLANEAPTAAAKIDAFMMEKGVAIEKGTEQYLQFMKDILLGEYPELTTVGSKYVGGQDDLDQILEYATEQMGPIFKDFPIESPSQEAFAASEGTVGSEQGEAVLAYSRTNAINYAYAWWNGQNSSYPDFGSNDCTNFISQSMKAGGFSFRGSGDGCRDESTQTEWYVNRNSPPLWCIGSNRDWVWSTAWSVVYDFKRYYTYYNAYASELGWTTSASTAKSLLSPGDIVQLQQLQGGNWVSYHNMLVTKETSSDLLMTYNSTDTKDKPLGQIPTGSTQRYVLIRFP